MGLLGYKQPLALLLGVLFITLPGSTAATLLLNPGPEEIVQVYDPNEDLQVSAYSVPSLADWNNDGRRDLVIGEGGSGFPGYIRIYLNEGTDFKPRFSDYFYVQSNGSNLTHFWDECYCGCLGLFPRVSYWDEDDRKDLIVGTPDGYVKLFVNTGTDNDPNFGSGVFLEVGSAGSKSNIDVGLRATPSVVDWNSDGKKDLVVGELYGGIHLFINEGSNTDPNFLTEIFAQENGSDLFVPPFLEGRSSPVVSDLDGDGKKDILTGNTEGQLLFYSNTGSDEDPNFSGYLLVDANDLPIDLPDTPRSRPFVCDWTGDGYPDVLIGAADGKVRLYQSIDQPGDIDNDYDVEFVDMSLFGTYWMDNCTEGDLKCKRADLNSDGEVGVEDLRWFADNWLAGVE